MPHCVLEHSNNLIEKKDFPALFKKLHVLLAAENLFNIEDIKSRAVEHNQFYVGSGELQKSFVALTISILKGRDIGIKKNISTSCLEFLKTEFASSIEKQNCNITVRIDEIEKESYSRFTNI